ncbi:NPC1-like intracellular cholesterol transporter 1 [Coturnix japonica]|uniref:NPC1-like intracellular cholesterol transporter 1 n=1 Tax=Coturnix japonica TaxID=93934 RepID=UPI0013A5BFB3|nr:NPC1-like intracellular cholesterol transporter 1 [Coturnix japonica]
MAAAPVLAGTVLGALLAMAAPELTPIHAAGYCAFYGSCGRNPELNGSLLSSDVPCLDNSPARVASAAVLPLLRTVCPELVRGDNDTRLCCSMAQLTALRLSVALSGAVLSRCPSCARNFANLHCSNICSPDQSLFINVTRVADPVSPSGRRAVLEYQSFYRRRYAEAAFDSCIGVRLPATGGFALDTMCGIYGARLCTAQRWLDFQGDINNGLAPLRIRFVLLPDGTEPGGGIVALNGSAWPCRGSPGPELQPCSCQDCAASCPPIVAPTGPPAPFRLGSADGALVLCALLFSFFALLFLTAITCGSAHTSGRSSSSTSARSSSIPGSSSPRRGCCSRLSSGSHSTMAKLFRLWGTMVATRPVPVLVVSLVLVAGLGAGLHRVRLTTDPVELWSAPGSQARLEKDFHDRHFGPFFRTCQVIITEPRPGPAAPYHSVLLGSKNFSSVLNPAVLRELLRLQEELAELSVWVQEEQRAIQLKDVCYAPLNPGNATSADCCVNSVTQYFQNNRTRLAMEAAQSGDGTSGTADWRDHVMYCVNSPLSFMDITALEMSCMASYGGPVFPYIAFGGYPGSEYTEAEALILTYSLNNFPPGDPRQRWVLSWEERFLEELQRFQSKHSSNLSVSYMAERSLEDELSRTTAQDLPVFAVSYLLVFAYIALALGEFTAWRRVWVESKVTLALGGIAVVLGAVMAAMGLLALLGLPSSLIILEVVPFLVLAVGADNIFIFVQEYQQSEREPGETREQHIGRVLAQVAPSMMLCSLSEVICFCLGSLSSMPAVRTFALTAAVSIGPPVVPPLTPFPQDSYMLRFFSAMERYLHVGVPTYFVTTSGFNFSSTLGSNAICSSAGCDNNSLTQTIQYATQFPNVSYLAIPATSWLDDFLDWLNPTGRCCRVHRYGEHSGEFCPSTSSEWGAMGCYGLWGVMGYGVRPRGIKTP